MKRVLQFTLALLAGIQLAGGPYAIAQLYAWAGMLVSYSQQDGFAQAARDTFSGEKPCALCHRISEAKKEDHKRGNPNSDLDPVSASLCKLRTECPTTTSFLRLSPREMELFPLPRVDSHSCHPSTPDAPPVPPPERI